MILFVLVGIIISLANQRNKQASQKGAAPSKPETGKAASAAGREQPRPAPVAPSHREAPAPRVAPAMRTSLEGKTGSASKENGYGGIPTYTHMVTSSFESGHSHVESSMTGEVACPPGVQNLKDQQSPLSQEQSAILPVFSSNAILQGILYSQILGKPKALR